MIPTAWPRYLPAGDAALVVEFGDGINEAVNLQVRALAQSLAQAAMEGFGEAVITYRSLLVHYDPARWTYDDALRMVRERVPSAGQAQTAEGRLVEVPTVYGGDFGPDLEYVAEHNGLTAEEVVRLHTGADYPVYMLGFTPGFPYLGGLPPIIAAPRLETPRPRVPAGSVGIAGQQTGVYPVESPGGWRIIGRTPLRLFDPLRDPPALLSPGDRVRFVAISPAEFDNGA